MFLSNALVVFAMIASMGVAMLVASIAGAGLEAWLELRDEYAHARAARRVGA